jgi:clan AA aspartic protease
VIRGSFRDDAARARLTLIGDADSVEVEFVVDTGFTGTLALPPSVLARIGASLDGTRLLRLADGTERRAPFYTVRIEWDGEPHAVRAILLEDEPLIGVALLREYLLQVEVIDGGTVTAMKLEPDQRVGPSDPRGGG